MSEPSYYPLRPLRYPMGDTTLLFPEQYTQRYSDPHDPAHAAWTTDPLAPSSTTAFAPTRPQRFWRGPLIGHPPLLAWRQIKTPLVMALLPLFAIAYIAFCYIAHNKVVPLDTHRITPQHLATMKGAITSVSIIVISIALYPIYDTVSKLKSEEFFRVLTSHGDGVPLETLNHISTPSFGYMNMAMAVLRRRCSNYYILGIITSLLALVVTTLAPGILTVDSVLTDGELMAFAMGAVASQSVLNGSSLVSPAFTANLISDAAASVVWAEMELGAQYSFSAANVSDPDYAAFIAPIPLNLTTTTTARWLSDVIGLNPSCSWASTNITSTVQVAANSSIFNQYYATAYLPDFDLDVQVSSNNIPFGGYSAFISIENPTMPTSLRNHTTQAMPSDGSTVFLLGQCQSGCTVSTGPNITFDLTGINSTFTLVLTNQTWTMAVLVCIPNAKVETREVRHDGHGVYTVQPRPSNGQLTRQGNLNSVQTTALFSIATMTLGESGAGKLSGNLQQYLNTLGSQVLADLVLGLTQIENLPASQVAYGFNESATIAILPIEIITQNYTRVIQSAAKPYLSGYLGSAYVPGRVSQSELIFAASIPNLVVSTVVFGLLAVLLVLANFRHGKGVEFTLVNVAAAVHGSELPAQFAHLKGEQMVGEYGSIDEVKGTASDGADSALSKSSRVLTEGNASGDQNQMEAWGFTRVFMVKREDGSRVLHIG